MYAGEKESERVQKLRKEYWETLRNIKLEDLIFIDEAGVNLAMIRLYARSNKGERARGERPHKRGKRISMIGAVSHKEIIASANICGGVDGITFEAFINSKLVPKLWPGACVIMDNCSIHKGKEIKKAIEEAGAKLIFLPPYSPEFSPIENMWSKVKNKLKSLAARTYKELEEAIITALAAVTLENIHHWFTHCCYCTSSL